MMCGCRTPESSVWMWNTRPLCRTLLLKPSSGDWAFTTTHPGCRDSYSSEARQRGASERREACASTRRAVAVERCSRARRPRRRAAPRRSRQAALQLVGVVREPEGALDLVVGELARARARPRAGRLDAGRARRRDREAGDGSRRAPPARRSDRASRAQRSGVGCREPSAAATTRRPRARCDRERRRRSRERRAQPSRGHVSRRGFGRSLEAAVELLGGRRPGARTSSARLVMRLPRHVLR